MKVLYYSSSAFIDCDFPLVRALAAKGMDVCYLIHFAPFSVNTPLFKLNSLKGEYGIFNAREYPEFQAWTDYLNLDNVFVVNDPCGKTAKVFSNLKLLKELKRFARNLSPDVLHIVENPSIQQYHLTKGRKVVYTIHDPLPHSGEGRKSDECARKKEAGRSSAFLLLNSLQDEAFSVRYKVPISKIFHSRLGQYDCYRKFGTGKALPFKYILFFGRISPYKGVEYAVRAFKSIADRFSDVHFVIAGSGDAYFEEEIKGSDRIHLFNRYIPNDELADLMSGAQFVVCPYTDATQSGVVQTSFAFEKPVVASAVGSIPEDVEQGKTGLLVAPRSADALAESISALLSDDALRSAMVEEIRRRNSDEKLNWQRIAQDHIDLYNRI